VSNGHVQIPDEWLSVFADRQKYAYVETRDGHLSDCAKLAAAGQRVFEDAIVEIATWLQSVTQCENLCFAGGTALNCVANTRIRLETGFHDVFIPPAPHDGGTALGCAVYGMKEILKSPSQFRWSSDYLGAEPTYASELSALNSQFPDLVVNEPKMLVRDVARIIANGEIVALFQGRSESGPRALGHRSILADPRRREMRDWINKTIKGREMFRPLAPAVLIADVSAYFELQHSSPFMLYSTATRSDKRALIPAVVHVDGSARVQTVSEDDDPFLFKLLTSFRELTGIPVLLNTSFNSKNEPIVESINDAITCFVKFPIHRLVCPPFIITKKILPPVLREKVETEEHVH
jgi:carbamoyltransferase